MFSVHRVLQTMRPKKEGEGTRRQVSGNTESRSEWRKKKTKQFFCEKKQIKQRKEEESKQKQYH